MATPRSDESSGYLHPRVSIAVYSKKQPQRPTSTRQQAFTRQPVECKEITGRYAPGLGVQPRMEALGEPVFAVG